MPQHASAAFAAATAASPKLPLDVSLQRLEGIVEHLHSTLDAAALTGGQPRSLPGRAGALLDSLPAGVLLIDNSGRIAACNRAARELLGPGLQGQAWEQIVKTHLVAGEDGMELVLHDGRRINVATRPMVGAAGQVVMLSDVSETRALQRLVQRRSRLAELGEMLARLAHQLGTPLATSALYAHELSRASDDPERRRDLAVKLEKSLARLRSQVRDMQVFTSTAVVAGTQTRVGDLLAAFFDLVRPSYAAAEARLQIDSRVDAAALRVNVPALASVFANLADNALQARPRDLHLTVTAEACEEGIRFAFSDNGPGVSPEVASQMFETFFTTRETGTGLGLAVAKSVVEAHGGRIRHDAAADGCRIVIELPDAAPAAQRGQR